MKWRLLPGVKQSAGRDIVRVVFDDGTMQPFYRSSGRNSKQAGKWFPFDGLWPFPYPIRGWFIKDRFGHDRLGNSDFYSSISDALGVMLPQATLEEVNEWLGLEFPSIEELAA